MSQRHFISVNCITALRPQIITKIYDGDRKQPRRVTYFVSMCGKDYSICTPDWTCQPISSSPTGRAVSPNFWLSMPVNLPIRLTRCN